MSKGKIIALIIVGILVLLIARNWAEWNIANKFVVFLIGTIIAAYLGATVLLPALGDRVLDFFSSPPEDPEPDARTEAVAKLAQGDYRGAISKFKSLAKEAPDDRFPIVEIAKIQLEHLDDPDAAITTIRESIDTHDWAPDDNAFLRFRLGELHLEGKQDEAQCKAILQGIIADFPETRHSANATHRLNEISRA